MIKMRFLMIAVLACMTVLSASAKVKFTEKDFADTIHIKYTNGKIMVPVTIGGRTYDFWYDTGANISQIPDSLTDLLFARNLKSRKVTDYNNEKSDKTERGVLKEATIGKIHVIGLQCTTVKSDRFILGAHELYLANVGVKIDLRKGIMILSNRKNFFKGEEVHLMPDNVFSVLTDLKFDMSHGVGGYATFDTGNNMFFSISRKIYDQSSACATGRDFVDQTVWTDTVTLAGFSARPVDQEQILLNVEELKMGDLTFHNVPVMTTDKYNGFGCRMLEYGCVIVDGRRLEVYYEPYTDGAAVEMGYDVPQVKLDQVNGNIFVKRIYAKSDIYAAGVRIGDRLESIDGKNIDGVDSMSDVLLKIDKDKPWALKFRSGDGKCYDVTVRDQRKGYFFTF